MSIAPTKDHEIYYSPELLPLSPNISDPDSPDISISSLFEQTVSKTTPKTPNNTPAGFKHSLKLANQQNSKKIAYSTIPPLDLND